MKYIHVILILLLGVLSSCNQDEIDKLESQQVESVEQLGKKDSEINDLISEMNEIAGNLQVIREKQGVYNTISGADGESLTAPNEDIRQEIEMIDFLMTSNLDRIEDLEKKIEQGGEELSAVRKLLNTFKKDVAAKTVEIDQLKSQIVEIEGQYSSLMDDYMTSKVHTELQKKQLALKEDELNTVYYAYGSKAELIEHNVIKKKGGVLGLGAANIMKGDFNKDYFTLADARSFNGLALPEDKVQILTEHPSASYELAIGKDGEVSQLVIKDNMQFWSGSKYLVVMTK